MTARSSHAFVRTTAPRLHGDKPSRAAACRRKFLRYFAGAFRDETYLAWERDYKAAACKRWQERLGVAELRALVAAREYREVGMRAVAIESQTNLLFSFRENGTARRRAGAGGCPHLCDGAT
jgi:hypothetical protein